MKHNLLVWTAHSCRRDVDHAAFNFHPNVSRSFAVLAGPGIRPGRRDDWISIMDLKPTLCRMLQIDDRGGSAYGVDLMAERMLGDRILADVTSTEHYSLFRPSSGWLLMSVATDAERKPFEAEVERLGLLGMKRRSRQLA